ncbi:MAG: FAD-binding protein [Polyangiaceae bacterium]|nr:FAD-binding protein [Polyangiaceae bacterium]MCW5789320.1 FAD-binding protein [Polyangiaceae bacterium]
MGASSLGEPATLLVTCGSALYILRVTEASFSVPPSAPASVERAKRELRRQLGDSKLLEAEEAVARYARDESEAEAEPPDVVVLAESREDILTTLAIAERFRVPVTPRAGGTGRTGGAVPVARGIVLSVSGMNQIREIDAREGLAVVGPGVVLADLQRAVEAEGWFYPPDPNSLQTCQLGGNVAENAGGPRAFKYGVTRDYVLGMEAFLMGGQALSVGRRTRKGVTGYDVTALLVGSEGTLAVLGDVTLRLIPKPASVMTLLISFASLTAAAGLVEAATAARLVPRCFELLDRNTLAAMRAEGNPIDPRAEALLLVEVDGEPAACERDAERLAALADDLGALTVEVAQGEAPRERLWAARRAMSPAVRKMAKHKLSEDVVVPRQAMGELLSRVARVSEETQIRTVTYGHAGDGNLHVNFLWDHEEERPKVERSIERLFQAVVELRGTLSGEHGIGVLKAPYLPLEQSPQLIQLQRELKRVFDPQGLLNPGKIFPRVGHGAC